MESPLVITKDLALLNAPNDSESLTKLVYLLISAIPKSSLDDFIGFRRLFDDEVACLDCKLWNFQIRP